MLFRTVSLTGVAIPLLLRYVFIGLLSAAPVLASTIQQTSFIEIVRSSEFIVDGRVLPGTTLYKQTDQSVFTCVTVEPIEVIRGPKSDAPIEVCYAGGVKEDLELVIPGVTIPAEGSRQVFMLADPTRPYVHPITGWDSGVFRVARDQDGRDVVLTSSGSPVIGIDLNKRESILGEPAGVLVGDVDSAGRVMTVQEFKSEIRKTLNQ